MRVILNQTVPKLGKQGQVVKVQPGYARNYLFPKGLAIAAERNQLAVLEKRMARVAAADVSSLEGAMALKEKLDGQAIEIEGKAGSGTSKLFGAITSQNIVDAIKDQLKVSLEKKQVALIDPIKRLGRHSIELDLHREVEATVTLTVFDPTAPVISEALPELQEALDASTKESENAHAPKPKKEASSGEAAESGSAEGGSPAEAEPVAAE